MKNNFYNLPFSLLIFFSLIASTASYSQTPGGEVATKKCLIVSDIHFNPLYGSSNDTALRNKLIKSSPGEWKGIFESSKTQTTINASLLYQDANYGILKSGIANMKAKLPHPAFIVIAGDFIWHGATPADKVLKRKSIQFIAGLFKESFPGVPIIPAMGNNDTYGNDYQTQDAEFLKDFADAWEPNLPKRSADSLKAQGYYTFTSDNFKLIVVNSSLLNNGTHYPQANVMLNWLQGILSEPNTKNVWMVMHIPPGLNVYSNNSNFWNAAYSQTFINSVVKYSSKVKFGIASHTHFNDFRVFYNNEPKPVPVAFMRIVPSIGSNHGNNPSFEIAEFNNATSVVIKETNYYLDLAAIPASKGVTQAEWNSTIVSPAIFKSDKISASNLSKFMDNIKTDKSGELINNYVKFYTVGTDIPSFIRVSPSNYPKYLKVDSLKEK